VQFLTGAVVNCPAIPAPIPRLPGIGALPQRSGILDELFFETGLLGYCDVQRLY
jgi:hypothetical protein